MSKKKKFYCICGETCSGKDTLVNDIIKKYPDKLKLVCSYATRPRRDNETEGKEHYFVTKEEFDRIKNEKCENILAYTKISSNDDSEGYEYMALEDELEKSNVYIIDPNGIKYLKDKYEDKLDIKVIYIYAPIEKRRERAKASRSDFEKEFEKRVEAEEGQFRDLVANKEYDYIVCNDEYRNTLFLLGILLGVEK